MCAVARTTPRLNIRNEQKRDFADNFSKLYVTLRLRGSVSKAHVCWKDHLLRSAPVT